VLIAPLSYAVLRQYSLFALNTHGSLWAQVARHYTHLPWLAWLAGVVYVLMLGLSSGTGPTPLA
jgi:hypothetical protein